MAVYQQTGRAVVSLPNGASSMGEEYVRWLGRFERVVLWMDSDEAGRRATEMLVGRLGANRTVVVKHDYAELKDANDFLLKRP